jgi:predicted  nucleic acid-binding Zn-ribbon protein
MPADSLMQKLIYLDTLLRYKECDSGLRSEIMQAQQELLTMQQEMLRLMKENQQLRQELDLARPKPVSAKTRSRLFSAKAS